MSTPTAVEGEIGACLDDPTGGFCTIRAWLDFFNGSAGTLSSVTKITVECAVGKQSTGVQRAPCGLFEESLKESIHFSDQCATCSANGSLISMTAVGTLSFSWVRDLASCLRRDFAT